MYNTCIRYSRFSCASMLSNISFTSYDSFFTFSTNTYRSMDDLHLVIKEEAPTCNSHTDSSPLDMNIPSSSNSGSSSGSLEDTLRNSIDLATFDEINKMISYVSEMSEIAKLYFLIKLPGSAISQNNANAT